MDLLVLRTLPWFSEKADNDSKEADGTSHSSETGQANRCPGTDKWQQLSGDYQCTQARPANKRGGEKSTPESERKTDVKIFDIYGNTAIVRVDAGRQIDYMHMAKWNGE